MDCPRCRNDPVCGEGKGFLPREGELCDECEALTRKQLKQLYDDCTSGGGKRIKQEEESMQPNREQRRLQWKAHKAKIRRGARAIARAIKKGKAW